MIMATSPSGKALPEVVSDRPPSRSHHTVEWVDDKGNNNSTEHAKHLPINRNKTGCYTTQTSFNTTAVSNTQSQNPGQKTGASSNSAENGISQEPTSILKKDNRSVSAERTFAGQKPVSSPSTKKEPPIILERSDSVLSRSSSQQAKYHDSCIPQIDQTLIIGSPRRTPSPRPRRKRPNSFKRPGSDVSLLGRRESVTNLVFSGPSVVDEYDQYGGGWETAYKKRLSLGSFSYGSSLFSRMGSPQRELDVTPGEFDVIKCSDYSNIRMSSKTASCPSPKKQPSPSHSQRTGFLYQAVSFDHLARDVPPFVKTYTQKNGRMLTESFILKVNYLRRRRMLGEVTSTIHIGNSNHVKHSSIGADMNKSGVSPR